MLHRNISALKQLIAENTVTNHPTNKIVKEREDVFEMIHTGIINYSSLIREPETLLFYKNMVILTLQETFT